MKNLQRLIEAAKTIIRKHEEVFTFYDPIHFFPYPYDQVNDTLEISELRNAVAEAEQEQELQTQNHRWCMRWFICFTVPIGDLHFN